VWKHRRFRFGDLVFHGGGTPGFTTFLGFCPNAGIGLLTLRNATITPTNPFIQSTYDLLKALARERGLHPVQARQYGLLDPTTPTPHPRAQ
jgi:hypothetical protein